MSQSSGYSFDRGSRSHDSRNQDKEETKNDDMSFTKSEDVKNDRDSGSFEKKKWKSPFSDENYAGQKEEKSSKGEGLYGESRDILSPATSSSRDNKNSGEQAWRSSLRKDLNAESPEDSPAGTKKDRDAPDLYVSKYKDISKDIPEPSFSTQEFPTFPAQSQKDDEMTNEERFSQILDLLGRLENRLRQSESEREETERDVQGLRESLDSLEDKYLRTDKAFFEMEGKVGKIERLEHKLENINMADHEEFGRQIEDVRNLITSVDEKADNSERAFLKVDQKISSLQRQEEDWRESEEDIRRRQEILEKSVHDSKKELESTLHEQQAGFEDVIYQRQRETEQRLNERQNEISQTQTGQDERLGVIEYQSRDISERVETTQNEQIRMIEKIDDILAQQNRINRRLDKAEQDKLRLQRKIDYLSEMVDRNNQALEAKAMVLLTDQSIAENSNRPYVQPALRREVLRKGERFEQESKEGNVTFNYQNLDLNEIEHDTEQRISSAEDEETPPETRLKERQVLTGRDEEQEEREQEQESQEKSEENAAASPFESSLEDFGDSGQEIESERDEQEKIFTGSVDNEHTDSNKQKKTLDLGRVQETRQSLDDEEEHDKGLLQNKMALVSGSTLAVLLVCALVAGFAIKSSRNAEIQKLEQAIAQSRNQEAFTGGAEDSRPDTPISNQMGLASSNNDSQAAIERNRQAEDTQRADTAFGDSGQADTRLRADEMVLEPELTGNSPASSAEKSQSRQEPIKKSSQAEKTELTRLSPDLNKIEPSAPIASIEPPKKPRLSNQNQTAQNLAALRQDNQARVEPEQNFRDLTGSFFDPMTDAKLQKQLEQDTEVIDAFLKTQPHGNLQERIRPDPTLSPIVRKIEEKAFQGIPEAQHDLAAIYTAGHAGTDQNFERSAFWFREAAVQGIANARYNLGVLYHQGLGVKADLKTAIKWYKTASLVDHPEAQYNLGIAHIEGIGTQYRPEIAAFYFTKAARQNIPEAAYNLGLIYENGLTGERHQEVALYWYQIAAGQGSKDAQAAFNQLKDSLGLSEKDVDKITSSISKYYGERENLPHEQGSQARSGQWAKPELASLSSSQSFSNGENSLVSDIQEKLSVLGYYPGVSDGAFGPKTEDAIRSYQQDQGLKVTGLPSRELLDNLKNN